MTKLEFSKPYEFIMTFTYSVYNKCCAYVLSTHSCCTCGLFIKLDA